MCKAHPGAPRPPGLSWFPEMKSAPRESSVTWWRSLRAIQTFRERHSYEKVCERLQIKVYGVWH